MMQLKEKIKEREQYSNVPSRQNVIVDIKSIKPYSEHSNLHFKSPLRSSGIHFKVKNAWNHNLTFDQADEGRKSSTPRRSHTRSHSLSLGGSLNRTPSPIEIKQK